ncbi:hypothetical protein K438DRAFT_1797085 [Mycena galopus ATCC 62051]|nr:hypothetical protein K438DRAFT_1797085 [Mycena galopus ATCC 62051]
MYDSSTDNTPPDVPNPRRARKPKRSRDIKDVFTAPKHKRDAFVVPKYKTFQDVADDGSQDEAFDFTGVDLTRTDATSGMGNGNEAENPLETEGRRAKRRKVAHDLNFLETSLVQATPSSSPSDSAFDIPSSDLLKCIHHFACNYYSERGQLFNESRTWRKGRKERKRARLAAKEKLLTEDANSDEEGPDADPPPKTAALQRRDMYKTMDGSALLAIGMLLQEHIARLLTPRIPDGWEHGNFDDSGGEDEDEDPCEEIEKTVTDEKRDAESSQNHSDDEDGDDETGEDTDETES